MISHVARSAKAPHDIFLSATGDVASTFNVDAPVFATSARTAKIRPSATVARESPVSIS